jgi:hypothetical protein
MRLLGLRALGLSELMGSWTHGLLGSWALGLMDSWALEIMVLWLMGSLALGFSRNLGSWDAWAGSWTFGHLGSRLLGATLTLLSRYCKKLKQKLVNSSAPFQRARTFQGLLSVQLWTPTSTLFQWLSSSFSL